MLTLYKPGYTGVKKKSPPVVVVVNLVSDSDFNSTITPDGPSLEPELST